MEIINGVATATLTVPLDLKRLRQHLKGSVFQKGTGHWLKYRLQPENRYIAFYKSGKFLITGKRVIGSLDTLVQRVLALIRLAGVDTDVLRVDVNNIVAKDTLNLKAPLETIIASLDPQGGVRTRAVPGTDLQGLGREFPSLLKRKRHHHRGKNPRCRR